MRRSWQRSTERQVRVTATSRRFEPSRAGRRQVVEAVTIPVINRESMWVLFPLCAAANRRVYAGRDSLQGLAAQMAVMHSAACVEIGGVSGSFVVARG